MDEVIKKIQSKGYWQVQIRPNTPPTKLIPLPDCLKIIKESSVSLRGWDYPHVDHETTVLKNDFVESHCSFMDLTEYWRFFQSGQFIHFFTIREDWAVEQERLRQMLDWFGRGGSNAASTGFSIQSNLYSFTEVLQFASRLAKSGALGDSCVVSIKLFGMKGRQLFYWSPDRHLDRAYICHTDSIEKTEVFKSEDLIARADEIAFKWFIETMHLFQWMTPAEKLLKEDQIRMLEKRL